MSFSDLTDDMDAMLMSSLKDGVGTCANRNGVLKTSDPIEVMVDRNLQQTGEGGVVFSTDAVGITWLKSSLTSVERGDVWAVGTEQFCVEQVINDDGQWVTAACMAQL